MTNPDNQADPLFVQEQIQKIKALSVTQAHEIIQYLEVFYFEREKYAGIYHTAFNDIRDALCRIAEACECPFYAQSRLPNNYKFKGKAWNRLCNLHVANFRHSMALYEPVLEEIIRQNLFGINDKKTLLEWYAQSEEGVMYF